MILYFSGTGNSRYVARKIAQELNDELISLNQLIKEEKTDELISTNKPFIFVCPTYAWRLPIVVTDFIKKTKFSGNNKVYFIMTCGGDTSKAINYIQKLCNEKNWQLKGMAENQKPVWGNNCTHCMACICGCPTQAIEYKNNTQNKERYYLK